MNHRLIHRAVAVVAAFGAGCALAQGKPVVSDVAPPPAESRDSAGAIVLHHAPVRAQRAADADPAAATRTMGNAGSVGSAESGDGHGTMKQPMQVDPASMREAEARELRVRGASSLIAK